MCHRKDAGLESFTAMHRSMARVSCYTPIACQFPPGVDPGQLVVVSGAMHDQVVHEAMPLGLPDRSILLTNVLARHCSTSLQGSRTCGIAVAPAAAVALCAWPLTSLSIFDSTATLLYSSS